jgi:2Fe-2S ferredoxin
MPQITFVEANGASLSVDVLEGWSLMQAATANGIEGILGECGGSCACATCHCYVDDMLAGVLPAPSQSELDMLEHVAAERRPNSRLACQLKATASMDGGQLSLPEVQE